MHVQIKSFILIFTTRWTARVRAGKQNTDKNNNLDNATKSIEKIKKFIALMKICR